MFLEKINLKKILIFTLSLVLVSFLMISPVYASNTVSEEGVQINFFNNKGSETVYFHNTEMNFHSSGLYNVTFDAEFIIEVPELDQVVIDKNFSEFSVGLSSYFNIFTGFRFDFSFYDKVTEQDVIRTGFVNMIDNGYISSTNMLDGFSDAFQNYEVILKGNSALASDPESVVLRNILVHEGNNRPFPIASSATQMRPIEVYSGSLNNINYNILGENDEYLYFQPTEVILRFEGVSFIFDPFQEDMPVYGHGLIANGYGYLDVAIPFQQTLTNFDYDRFVKVEVMQPTQPPVPRTDFRFETNLRFENEIGAGGVPGDGEGFGPGSGSLFSIIPSIMVAIFSFFWMIGSVELAGIPGLTLVGITTFFVAFMVIKFIIGLFKGGGD